MGAVAYASEVSRSTIFPVLYVEDKESIYTRADSLSTKATIRFE